MQTKRVDPLQKQVKEEARWVNINVGVCPVCQQPMKILKTNGINSYTCISDRIALPVQD